MKDFRQLKIWNESHKLALDIYSITNKFPKEELFGLTSQLRRAVLSIPTNIAEGCGRGSDSDFSRFLQISFGSASEVDYLIQFSFDIKYLSIDDYQKLNQHVIEIKKSIAALMKKIKSEC